jgi:small conductance mechanosensitive channel
MLNFVASLLLLANVNVSHPAAAAPPPAIAAGIPGAALVASDNSASDTPAEATSPEDAAPANPSAFERFKHTKLFELAEGKKTTTLREMLQPAFWIDTIKELIVAAVAFVPRLLVSLSFLFIFWLLYRGCRRLLSGAMHRSNVDPSVHDLLLTVTKWAIMGFGLVIACNQIGIPIVAMLTGVSILGLAVGFAAQETLANFIAGIVIFWDKPFKVGDLLTVDGVDGEVQRVTFRSCRLLDWDGQLVIFPNTYMLAHRVINHSAHPVTRVGIPMTIASSESIGDARTVLLDLISGDDRVRPEPKPGVFVSKLGEGTIDVQLSFWVSDERTAGGMKGEYTEKVKAALDNAGIALAHRNLRVVLDDKPGEASPEPRLSRAAA